MNNQGFMDREGPERDDESLEKQWISEVRNGDRVAFRKIFEMYYEPLLSFAFRYLNTKADAEGAVQDVFLWIWEKREDWTVEKNLKTYLYRAVKYRCLDLIRKKLIRDKYVSGQIEGQQTDQQSYETQPELDNKTFEQLVRKAIEKLPPRAKMIYKLSRTDGLTYNEIAQVMDISPKTVESQMSRALHALRSQLAEYFTFMIVVKKVVDAMM